MPLVLLSRALPLPPGLTELNIGSPRQSTVAHRLQVLDRMTPCTRVCIPGHVLLLTPGWYQDDDATPWHLSDPRPYLTLSTTLDPRRQIYAETRHAARNLQV